MTYDALTLPAPRPARKAALLKWPRLATFAMVAAAGAALLSFGLRHPSSLQAHAEMASAPATPARWLDIAKPYQLYILEAPELAKLPKLYEARRQNEGAGRLDSLTFGSFGSPGAWLVLGIRRFGAETSGEPGFFVDIARRAAQAGVAVSHSAVPAQIASRFGGMDHAAVVLERGGIQARCLAFRSADTGPDFGLTGLYCAAGKEPEAGNLVCLLDRLGLAVAGEDLALRKIFVSAELKREQFCAGGKYVVARAEEPEPAPPPAIVPVPAPATKARLKKRKSS